MNELEKHRKTAITRTQIDVSYQILLVYRGSRCFCGCV